MLNKYNFQRLITVPYEELANISSDLF